MPAPLIAILRVTGESVFLPCCPFATVNKCYIENLAFPDAFHDLPNEVRSTTVIDS